ncbi:unnamed protein product [Lasius platythorax]|uniref:Uncharacterized protein n=1 Tax=Lasius platythorax TaxID=488582 RepID=A0AAV2NXV7_9HYME
MEEEDKKEERFFPTSWAQTLFTVTPKEDVENVMLKHKDVELREIKSTSRISANVEDFFDISEEDFISRLPLLIKHLINFRELERESTRDAENQTFLQGVPTVGIPIEYKHEASQTMYMSSPCPPAKYSEHITSMNVSPMPVFKSNYSSQTTITIAPRTSQHEAVNYLSRRTYEKHEENLSENIIDEETIILEVLNFLLSRAFWISDPVHDRTSVEVKCQETQTAIRYNRNTDSIVLDNETQTRLTCKPRHSNSKLLAEYEETKSFVQSCLRECLRRIEPRIIIDDLIDEIIVRGANRLKYPMKDRLIQTVASYKSRDIKEEDLLRKLKIPVVVDPFEASIVVLPLIDDLLRSTCDEISRDARRVVKNILNSLMQQTVLSGFKFVEIRKQSQPDSIEQRLDRRRKKIVESMLKKETETAATQTGLAGVPEVTRLKESKEILCSVCARQSICHWCVAAQKEEDLPLQSTKLLRTQDILLAYNPCYVVATASEKAKNPHLQPTDLMKKKIETLTAQSSTPQYVTPEETGDVVNNKTVNILMTPKKDIQIRDSISGWARIIDSTLAKSWSLKDSASNTTSVSTARSRSVPKSYCKKSSQSESVPSLQATKALEILKSTFCTRDTCPAITFLATTKRNLPDEDVNEEHISCNVDDCTLLNLDQHCRRSINNSQICARPRVDKFRIAPTRPLSEFRGRI